MFFHYYRNRKKTRKWILIILAFRHHLFVNNNSTFTDINTPALVPTCCIFCVCLLVYQTAYIPDELYKRIYDFCKRLMTFPQPYCTVGLSYARQMKTERAIPGIELLNLDTTGTHIDPNVKNVKNREDKI